MFSGFGLLLTITTALIVVFFFRNYEFHEANLLKRRYKPISIVQLICRFLLTFFYFLDVPIVLPIKHILANTIGVALLIDGVQNRPFRHHLIARFYTAAIMIFYVMMVFSHLWIFTDQFPIKEFFYYLVFIGKSITSCTPFYPLFDYSKEFWLLHGLYSCGRTSMNRSCGLMLRLSLNYHNNSTSI